MSPLMIIFLLLLGGAVLLIAELFLPTHGILGIIGGVTILVGVAYAFAQNQWAGAILMVMIALSIPFVWAGMVKWWPGSPLGRKVVLQPIEPVIREIPVQIGQTGQSLSALRPTGICEIGGKRLEAQSELGMIEPGTSVKVVAVDGGRITVRSV